MGCDTTSSGAGWSPPGSGRVRMLHATSIPCSFRCGRLATPGITLSPAAGSPGKNPLHRVTASPSQSRSRPGRRAAWRGPRGSRGGRAEHPSLPTLRVGTCQPGTVSPHCGRGQLQPCFILHRLPSGSRRLVASRKQGQEPARAPRQRGQPPPPGRDTLPGSGSG